MTGIALSDCVGFEVSTETLQRLQTYADLVAKWNPRINLVSRNTLPVLWDRHIIDSAQLYRFVPGPAPIWADLGSGGGFPGIVMAILSLQARPEAEHILVESDQRKCAFLIEAIRVTGCRAKVLNARVEKLPPMQASVITARALAALPELLGWIQPHLAADGHAVLPKGAAFEAEVAAARDLWDFNLDISASQTDDAARILRLSDIKPRA